MFGTLRARSMTSCRRAAVAADDGLQLLDDRHPLLE
jgi:hypothetical protein